MPLDTNSYGIQTNSLISPQKVVSGTAVLTVANTAYGDTVPNAVQLLPASANGQRVTRISALARATNTATELQLFTSADGGTTKRFIKSVAMSAWTVSQIAGQVETSFGYTDALPLLLLSTESLWAGAGVALAAGIVVRAEGGAY